MSYGIYQKGRFLAGVLRCQRCHCVREEWLDMDASVPIGFWHRIQPPKCVDGRVCAVY